MKSRRSRLDPRQIPLFQLDWDEPSAPADPPPIVDAAAPADALPTAEGPAARLAERLRRHLPAPLASVVLTDNRRRIVSARPTPAGLALRIHRAFATADELTLAAVATIVGGGPGEAARRDATERVRRHHESHVPPATRRRPTLRPRGEVHDLTAILATVVRRSFVPASPDAICDAALPAVAITWGRENRRRRRRGRTVSIRLGSYDVELRLVRIHPALDVAWVPAWVVDFVVYHELLHALLPPQRCAGNLRRRVHPPELRDLERRHPRFADAERWIADHLLRLTSEASRRR